MQELKPILIIGGGAAGYFAAIRCASLSHRRVLLCEATRRPLKKVKVSGGGRCNVTHHLYDPVEFIKNYPRGTRELRGPFSRFQAEDTVKWFESRGVQLKAEADGRMFSVTDSSQTIIDCLEREAQQAGVVIELGYSVSKIEKHLGGFKVWFRNGHSIDSERVLLATGSTPIGYELAKSLGHSIVPGVPSLFTFGIEDPRIDGLSGLGLKNVALELTTEFMKKPLRQQGPLLVTHWGLSGPAVLKLSAYGARVLHESGYKAKLRLNWASHLDESSFETWLIRLKDVSAKKHLAGLPPDGIPRNLWRNIIYFVFPDKKDLRPVDLSNKMIRGLSDTVFRSQMNILSKGVFKDEFVTCGGVKLKEVDFKLMESKICPGLHFAGEILDIDGITGGFNFQNAWTTGYLAGEAMA